MYGINMLKSILGALRFSNGLQVLANRLLWNRTGPTIYRHNSLTFLVDHDRGDQDGPRSCVFPGLYDPFLMTIRKESSKNALVFLDLGANAGGFILALLKNGFEIERGTAVELNPITWSRLVYNAYANVPDASSRLKLLNGAAGCEDGTLNVRLGNGSVADSITGDKAGTRYTLPSFGIAALLNNFNPTNVDLLKIDIEGAEYSFLSILPNVLNNVRWIIIEVHEVADHDAAEIHEWLEAAGFVSLEPSSKPVESNVFLYRNEEYAMRVPSLK